MYYITHLYPLRDEKTVVICGKSRSISQNTAINSTLSQSCIRVTSRIESIQRRVPNSHFTPYIFVHGPFVNFHGFLLRIFLYSTSVWISACLLLVFSSPCWLLFSTCTFLYFLHCGILSMWSLHVFLRPTASYASFLTLYLYISVVR